MSKKHKHSQHKKKPLHQKHQSLSEILTNTPDVVPETIPTEEVKTEVLESLMEEKPTVLLQKTPMISLGKIPRMPEIPEIPEVPALPEIHPLPEEVLMKLGTVGRPVESPPPETSSSPELPVEEAPVESPVGVLEKLTPVDSGTTGKIREYCTVHSISLVMKALCESVPEALPNYTTWNSPDPVPLIHAKIQETGYVEKLFPALKVMMRDNIKNIQWAARVTIAIAVYDVVKELGNS